MAKQVEDHLYNCALHGWPMVWRRPDTGERRCAKGVDAPDSLPSRFQCRAPDLIAAQKSPQNPGQKSEEIPAQKSDENPGENLGERGEVGYGLVVVPSMYVAWMLDIATDDSQYYSNRANQAITQLKARRSALFNFGNREGYFGELSKAINELERLHIHPDQMAELIRGLAGAIRMDEEEATRPGFPSNYNFDPEGDGWAETGTTDESLRE